MVPELARHPRRECGHGGTLAPSRLEGLLAQAFETRKGGGRPIAQEVQALIRRMAGENRLWGQRRIQAELAHARRDHDPDGPGERRSGQPTAYRSANLPCGLPLAKMHCSSTSLCPRMRTSRSSTSMRSTMEPRYALRKGISPVVRYWRITRPNCSICAGVGRKNWIRHFMRPADKRDAGRQAQILRRFPCRQPFRVTEVSSRSMERVIQLSDAGASG